MSPKLLEQAQAFLDALGGEGFTFQTFDDSEGKRKGLTRIIRSQNILTIANKLARLNEAGAGIFVTVNETDGNGRTANNIKRVRALFIDGDDIPRPDKWHRLPDFLCWRDATHWHAYWLVSNCPLDKFKEAQKRLIQFYKSDPNPCDLPRVMRVPGFLHRKSEPILYYFEKGNGNGPVHWEQVMEGIPPLSAKGTVTDGIDGTDGTEELRKQNEIYGTPLTVEQVIAGALPGRAHINHSFELELARGIRGLEIQKGWTLNLKQRIELFIKPWYERNKHLRPGRSYDNYLEEVLVALSNVKAPLGCGDVLSKAMKRARELPLPELPAGATDPYLSKAAALCRELQLLNEKPFLSSETLRVFLGLDTRMQAWRKLQVLKTMGVIEIVEKGGPPKHAARFRYSLPLYNTSDSDRLPTAPPQPTLSNTISEDSGIPSVNTGTQAPLCNRGFTLSIPKPESSRKPSEKPLPNYAPNAPDEPNGKANLDRIDSVIDQHERQQAKRKGNADE